MNKQVKKNDTSRARLFAIVFNTILTYGEIEFSLKRFILLNFKKEYIISINEGLLIDLQPNQFSSQLYDKTDDFPFSLGRMPFLRSNTPSEMSYSKYESEILRNARTTSSKLNFSNYPKKVIAIIYISQVKKVLEVIFKNFKNSPQLLPNLHNHPLNNNKWAFLQL